jgi:hypothetical protein
MVKKEAEKQLEANDVDTKSSNKSLDQLKVELFNSYRVIGEQKKKTVYLKSKIDSRDKELEMQNEIIAKLERLNGDYNDRDERSPSRQNLIETNGQT